MSHQQKDNSHTSTTQQPTTTNANKKGQITAAALASRVKANETPAMVQAERMKRFVSDQDTYARSVSPYNKGVEKSDGKREKQDGKGEKPDGKGEKPDGKGEKQDGKVEKSDGKTHP